MPDAETAQFRVSNEGEPIPPVDPEELKRKWNDKEPRACSAVKPSAISQEERERGWPPSRVVME